MKIRNELIRTGSEWKMTKVMNELFKTRNEWNNEIDGWIKIGHESIRYHMN